MSRKRIIIFAKAPLPGLAKTRLIPALGAERAAHLARRLLLHSMEQARLAGAEEIEVCVTPGLADKAWQDLASDRSFIWSEQCNGDLGARLAEATSRATAAGCQVLLMGTDCPTLTTALLREALQALDSSDSVMIPTADGGYALLALRSFHPSLFASIAWSTASVAAETRERIAALSWTLHQLPLLHDIDEAQDLQWLPAAWKSDLGID